MIIKQYVKFENMLFIELLNKYTVTQNADHLVNM
jgi:hypothetical protein